MQTDTTKRKLIWAGAAAAGLAAGTYMGWQRSAGEPTNAPAAPPTAAPVTPALPQSYTPAASPDAALKDLWTMEFDLPEGGVFKFATLQGKPMVLNFWATWCPPCIEELPLLDSFQRENAANGWQVVGIAADNAKAVKQFLAKTPLSFPSPLAGLAGVDLSRSLGNLGGGLPFTVVVNRKGDVALRHMGKLSAPQIAAFAALAA